MNKKRNKYSIFQIIYTIIICFTLMTLNPLTSTATSKNINTEIKSIVEKFISTTFSEYSAGKIVHVSKKNSSFLDYLKKRNELIKYRYDTFGIKVTKSSHTYKYTSLKINKNTCEVIVSDTQTLKFKGNTESSYATTNYNITLTKENNIWVITNATSNDSWSELFGNDMNKQSTKSLSKSSNSSLDNIIKEEKRNIKEESLCLLAVDSPPIQSKSTAGFSRSAMQVYQKRYAMKPNSKYKDYKDFGGDCTNYASQVLRSGGAVYDKTGTYRWFPYCYEWYNAEGLRIYLTKNDYIGPQARKVKSPKSLWIGDIVSINLDNKGRYDHSVVIYQRGSNPMISCHSYNRLNVPLSTFGGKKMYFNLTKYMY